MSLNIDLLIKQSMLDKTVEKTEVLRAIKNEFLIYQTAKNAKPLDDAAEITILNKMVKQRTESYNQYVAGNRQELADKEMEEMRIISGFLPKKATEADIKSAIYHICKDKGWFTINPDYPNEVLALQIPKKSMGVMITLAKEYLENVDGKQLSEIVKTYLV